MKSFEMIKIIGTLTEAIRIATLDLYGEVLEDTFGGFMISDPEVRAIREMELDTLTFCLNKAVKCNDETIFVRWLNEQQAKAAQLVERNADCGCYTQMLLYREKVTNFGSVFSLIDDYKPRNRHKKVSKSYRADFVDSATSGVDKEEV